MKEELLKLQKEIHANAVEKGFWKNNPSKEQMLMLVITEIAEVVEADRKKKYGRVDDSSIVDYKNQVCGNQDKAKELVYRTQIRAYTFHIKGTIEEELADVAIRLLDYMAGFDEKLSEDEFDNYANGEVIKNPVCDQMFYLTGSLVGSFTGNSSISATLGALFPFAKSLDIDLLWHIKEKMRYNESRPMLHNKKY